LVEPVDSADIVTSVKSDFARNCVCQAKVLAILGVEFRPGCDGVIGNRVEYQREPEVLVGFLPFLFFMIHIHTTKIRTAVCSTQDLRISLTPILTSSLSC
jgi:hypothetical protein